MNSTTIYGNYFFDIVPSLLTLVTFMATFVQKIAHFFLFYVTPWYIN